MLYTKFELALYFLNIFCTIWHDSAFGVCLNCVGYSGYKALSQLFSVPASTLFKITEVDGQLTYPEIQENLP